MKDGSSIEGMVWKGLSILELASGGLYDVKFLSPFLYKGQESHTLNMTENHYLNNGEKQVNTELRRIEQLKRA